jgi:hypothetical protein
MNLTSNEEDVIVQHVSTQNERGYSPQLADAEDMVNSERQQRPYRQGLD